MKTFSTGILLFVSALLLSFTPNLADDITEAINSGNPKNISQFFIENIDLKVFEKEGVYSKEQAEMILKDFFVKHPVKSYRIVHQSKPKNGAQYIIGTLETTNGTYRIYFLNKTVGTNTLIQQFRIETENE